jgi:hypothetical protein
LWFFEVPSTNAGAGNLTGTKAGSLLDCQSLSSLGPHQKTPDPYSPINSFQKEKAQRKRKGEGILEHRTWM